MRRGSRTWARLAVVAAAGGLSLLIWSKLKIVASVPRSAYADPQAQKTTANGQDEAEKSKKPPVVKVRPKSEPAAKPAH